MFTFYTDPGHGWLCVTLQDLANVGLNPWDFTKYSYRSRDGKLFYLEEDCDASKFVDAYVKLNKCQPKFKELYQTHSIVRLLPRI